MSSNRGLVKIGNHMLRSRLIVRPYDRAVIARINWLIRTEKKNIDDIQANDWCALIDSLSRCDCGRPVPPSRARYKKPIIAQTCSSKCCQRRAAREKRAADPAKESLHALSDALYQAGSNE